jgi:flagellar biosynthetic protein FlhB
MAEDNDPSSKTEEPTSKRLEDARKKGEVAKTPDLASWASLAGVTGVLAVAGGWMARDLTAKLQPFIASPDAFRLEGGGASIVAQIAAMAALPALVIVLGVASACGVAGNVVQTGFLWSPDKLQPDFSKLSIQQGLKRMLGLDGAVQFLKSLLKITVVGVICWLVMRPKADQLEGMIGLDPAAILPTSSAMMKTLAFAVLAALGLAAGLDWFWQHHRFMQKMRMSREEVKEDYRQSEGDPLIKAKIRQMRIERSKRRMMQAVPQATVVVMNPTHFAVALKYESGSTPAPLCVAKGMDSLALKIRAIAEENNVPVVEDAPLARALYASVEIDQVIPGEHYQAVAKVIGFVLNAARRRARRGL